MMQAFLRTTLYLFRSQLRSPLFYVMLAAALACAALPLFAPPSAELSAVICDRDGSALSRELIAQAQGVQTLRLAKTDESALPAALDRLKNGEAEAVFVVEKGYAENLNSGEYHDAVRLYLSPYSTSARTLSDTVAAIVLRQWLAISVEAKAQQALGEEAGREAARLCAAGASPIIKLNVIGDVPSAANGSAGAPQAKNALLALAALACFLLLCFPAAGAQDPDAMLDRFAARGWRASAYFLARSALGAAPAGIAALIPCVVLVVTQGAAALPAYPLFLLYLLAWLGIGAALECLVRNASVRLAAACVIAIFNAMLLYPEGLSQMMGPAVGLIAGYWLTQALQGNMLFALLPLCLYAALGIAVSAMLIELKRSRTT